MSEESDFQPNVITLYRELGQIEGRVRALEDTTREIKGLLNTITQQLNIIQTTVATAIGQKAGNKEVFGLVGYAISAFISAVTAYITLHYEK